MGASNLEIALHTETTEASNCGRTDICAGGDDGDNGNHIETDMEWSWPDHLHFALRKMWFSAAFVQMWFGWWSLFAAMWFCLCFLLQPARIAALLHFCESINLLGCHSVLAFSGGERV